MDADTQIFEKLLAGFRTGPIADHAELKVEVRDGVATISGRVYTLAERKALERAAKRVAGIRTLILKIGAAALPLATNGTLGAFEKDTAGKGLD
jgi:osmotically-inducible protein OsmY